MSLRRTGPHTVRRTMAMGVCLTAIVIVPLSAGVDTGQTRLFKYLMGTSMRVEVYGGTPAIRQEAAEEAFGAIAAVDRVMSDYRADSELSLVNAAAADRPAALSEPLFAALAAARRMTELTGGAFSDVRSGRSSGATLDAGAHTLRFTEPGTRLTLDGVAKGFAAEVAANSLKRRGLAGTIDTSGTQFVVGLPPGKQAWSVGIGDPRRAGMLLGAVDLPADVAVSTVSAASHPIDPRTGQEARSSISATVISPDGTLSDALSRAVFVLGPHEGLSLLARFEGTWGIVAGRAADGSVVAHASPGHRQAYHPVAAALAAR